MAQASSETTDAKQKALIKGVIDMLRGRARRARNIFHSDEHRQTGKATSGVC